jgi:hypothetical protein
MAKIRSIEENPWREIKYKVIDSVIKYGRRADKDHKLYVNLVERPLMYTGLRLELLHVPTGKTKKVNDLSVEFFCNMNVGWNERDKEIPVEEEFDLSSEKFKVMAVWTPYHYSGKSGIYYPVEEVQWRYEQRVIDKINWLCENLQVGDFVKCSGTRSGDWNKVEIVDIPGEKIYGPKYTKPEEGHMRYNSSDNSMTKIVKIVRDGKEIEIDT